MLGTLGSHAPAQPLPSLAALAGPRSSAADETLLLEIEINGERKPEPALLLRLPDGQLYAQPSTLASWRMRIPDARAIEVAGERFVPLDAIPGLVARYDAAAQRVTLDVPPAAFEATHLVNALPPLPGPTPSPPGAFLNYDAVATRGGGESTYGAQLEAGLFNAYGVLTSGAVAQHSALARGIVRLDTTFTHDIPERLETLRIGDAVGVAGAWGLPVRFGGLQWGTNFGIQPGFVAFPTVVASGQAALPSTVDVFVNNALVAQQPVPPGPFSITNIPTISGAGNVQLVVRDLLGRETVIAQPFYGATQLLGAGLSDYSVSAGALRRNFGIESDDYGPAMATAAWRHGFTSTFTAEVRAEAMRDQAAVGASGAWRVGELGVVEATIAQSASRDAGAGTLAGAAFSRQTGRASLDARVRWTTDGFRLVGDSSEWRAPKLESAATAGYQFGAWGSVSASYVNQRRHPADTSSPIVTHAEFASLAYTVSLPQGAAISVIGLRDLATGGGTTVTAVLTVPFGSRDSASLMQSTQRGTPGAKSYTQLAAQRSLPVGEGFGYRAELRSGGDYQAGVAWQGNAGRYTLDASHFGGDTSWRGGVAGGFGVLGGHAFASREITESFAVVQVDDYEGVGILLDNQSVGRTGAGGYAVLPRRRAYDVNRIALEQQDLPLDAELDRLAVPAVPGYRSGVVVAFPVRRSNGATFRLVLDDGGELPAGALVEVIGNAGRFPVGLGGVAYVTGLSAQNRLRATWRGASCTFELSRPASQDPLPDLGIIACHGVER